MKQLSFSILMPVHNPFIPWMEDALSAIYRQLVDGDEIVIVDDCSSNGVEIAGLAEKYAARLIGTDVDSGVKAHNLAISYAYGDLVHFNHPDDRVRCKVGKSRPSDGGFYATVRQAAEENPDIALFATRTDIFHEDGRIESPRPDWLRGSPFAFQPLHEGNPLHVPACVVRRRAYEEFGGWDERRFHVSDWDAWARMTSKGGAVCIDRPLAIYRMHAANHSSRLRRTGDNYRDTWRMGEIASSYMPVDREAFLNYCLRGLESQAADFLAHGDQEAARANREAMVELREMARQQSTM